jgi:hypothetical protein
MNATERPLRTETFTLMSQLPGFKQWEGYSLIFRPTGANLKYIRDTFPGVQWLEGTLAHLDKIASAEVEATQTMRMKTGPLPPLKRDSYQYKRLPRDHQRRALLMSWNKKAFALLMEQRTGKTKVVIDNAAHLFKLSKLDTLVIVTLNGVHRNWIDNEIPLDLPDWCHYEAYFQRGSHTKKQQLQFERVLSATNRLRIFAFNIEALSRDGRARDLFETAMGTGAGVMLAIDESADCIKNYDAKRTKYLIKFGGRAEYRRILTGTQAPEGRPDELFPQYKFLNPDILGYDTITTYRAHFCVTRTIETGPDTKTVIVVPGCRNLEELQALIDPHSFRVRRADCMDLPPKIYKRWPVELSPEQKRLYKELRDEYITELEGATLSAPMAMTRLMRLQQIVCGWFPMTENELVAGETWRNVRAIGKTNPRLEALDDILRTHPDKAIIWARFRPDLEAIQKRLGNRAVSYHGGIDGEQKAKNYRAFQNDPAINWLVANQSSAGRGLTLTAATMLVYYSNSFRLADRTQSEDRPEGDERKRDSTLVIDLETPGTVDSRIIRSLKGKKDMADLINRDPKTLFMDKDDD